MQIRQENNLNCESGNVSSGSSFTFDPTGSVTTTSYSGSPTYYFEVLATNSGGSSTTCTLRRKGTSTEDATVTITASTATMTLFRSAAFTPPAGTTSYVCFVNSVNPGTTTVKAARIIVLQNTASPTATETQIEIGNRQTGITATTLTALSSPKYWKYTSANWDGTIQAFFEATISSSSTKATCTAELQVADGTGDGFVNWAAVAGGASVSDVTTTSTTSTRVRTGSAFTPIAGRNYRVVVSTTNSKSSVNIYNAKIIILQTGQWTKLEPQYLLANTLLGAGTSLQTHITKWDSTEWKNVTNVYTAATDAANGSSSDTTIEQADGGGTVTNSTVTNPDNQGFSSAMTMPGDENLDCKATTNNGDVFSVRVLVAVTVLASTSKVYEVNQTLPHRSNW